MKVLILGGNGMLGHKVYQKFKGKCETFSTFRDFAPYRNYKIFEEDQVVNGFSIENDKKLEKLFSKLRPDWIINCIGITKQQSIAHDPIPMISVNSLFPHRLNSICGKMGIKLFQISTDCVFSGKQGNYKENDFADDDNLYGRTKFLGEVKDTKNSLTIRTSIIGRELKTSFGLVEWFLNQEGGVVNGFKKAIFSGFTTDSLAEIIIGILEKHSQLSGLYHISAQPISKYELLCLIKKTFKLKVEIRPEEKFYCDRSLDSSKFKTETGFVSPLWEYMIENLAAENEQYKKWRKL